MLFFMQFEYVCTTRSKFTRSGMHNFFRVRSKLAAPYHH